MPYTHPVYHNGKRMLWHGAWRGRAGHEFARSAPARAVIAARPAPQSNGSAINAAPQSQAPQSLKPFAILADPDDLTASRMAKDFVAVLNDKGAAGRAIVGPTSPTGLARASRSDMADFAVVTLDSLLSSVKEDPDWTKRTPLVTRLAPETLEIVAPREVKAIGDLSGKTVSFGDPESATATSARLLFSRLGITVNPIYEPLTEALDGLSSGKRAAVVVLGAKAARALDGFGEDGGYHIVAIPWSDGLEDVYAPSRVAAAERPNLVRANDSVETLAEPLALVGLDAPTGSQRADAIGRLTRVFFDNYGVLLSDDRDVHWRDVNLAADPSPPSETWPRLAAAQEWLDAHKSTSDASLDAFRASAKMAADSSGGPKAEDSDRLYESLTRWRSLMQ